MAVALVTGASSGIGAAVAIALADSGWDVMAAGRDEARLEEVADVSDRIATWTGDLAGSADCDELVADTVDEFGGIDCLVNSAGILLRADAAETSDDDWRDTMTINLDVPFYLSRAALPHLIEAEGNIVNISSYWGIQAGERATAYNTSKGALILLTKAMARDHGREGVRVNVVCPGGVDTPMHAHHRDFLMEYEKYIPLGRMTVAEDLVGPAIFLASDASGYITGQTLHVNGGMLIH